MPATTNTLLRDRTTVNVPLGQIVAEFGVNVRQEYDVTELEQLADSIAEHGLLQPLTVVGGPDYPHGDGTYGVLFGRRRYRALQLLLQAKRLKETDLVPVVVDNSALSPTGDIPTGDINTDGVVRMLIENLQRVDLSAIEEARGFSRLIDEHGCTQRDLARMVGKSPSHIAKRLALLGLPVEVQAMIQHQLPIDMAYRMSQLDDDQIRSLVKELGGKPAGSNFEWELKRQEDAKQRRADKAKFEKALAKAMIETVDQLPGPFANYERLGWYDHKNIAEYEPKRNHVIVRRQGASTIDVYRKLTAKQLEAQATQQAEAEAEAEASERDWYENEATPHERWEHDCRLLEDAHAELVDEYEDQLMGHLGRHLLDADDKVIGRYVMVLAIERALAQAQRACERLGIDVPDTDKDGKPLSSWQRPWKDALSKWINNRSKHAVRAYLAGHITPEHLKDSFFADFTTALAEAGITPPPALELPPEPVDEILDDNPAPSRDDFDSDEEFDAAIQVHAVAVQAQRENVT